MTIDSGVLEIARHRTAWIEAGPRDGPLMFFVHGWPELSLVWRSQLEWFAADGWRCIAPDMRGYGGSTVHLAVADYALHEIVADMLELHDHLGGRPAVWVGHDWGAPVVWGMASHYPDRCRGVVGICVPYLARGMTLEELVRHVDRETYPIERFPVGQWDYWLYHRQSFAQSATDLEAEVERTIAAFWRRSPPERGTGPSPMASIRAKGGWFGPLHVAPAIPRDREYLTQTDFDVLAAAFSASGFRGANAWYLNDAANAAYAAQATDFGRLSMPVLFVHAERDKTCDTVGTSLADPMRQDCTSLTERTIASGHEVSLEAPDALNAAIGEWLVANDLQI